MRALSVLAGVAALAVAVPASATITFSTEQGAVQGTNVVFQAATDVDGTTVFGTVGPSGPVAQFRTLSGQVLTTPSSGQARIETQTGAPLNTLEISLADPQLTFDFIEFNLFGGPGSTATNVTLAGVDQFGTAFTTTAMLPVGNGENFFVASTDALQSIRSVTFDSRPGGFTDIRQIRFGPTMMTAPIPEPSTWAMMLIGFGAVGFGLRRRKDQKSTQRVRFAF